MKIDSKEAARRSMSLSDILHKSALTINGNNNPLLPDKIKEWYAICSFSKAKNAVICSKQAANFRVKSRIKSMRVSLSSSALTRCMALLSHNELKYIRKV